MSFLRIALSFSLLYSFTPASSFEVKSRGQLGFRAQGHPDDNNALTQDFNYGLDSVVELDVLSDFASGKIRAVGSYDKQYTSENVFYFEDAYIQKFFGEEESLSLRLGYSVFNWSPMEVFHPNEILNARNLISSVEVFKKLGEMSAVLSYERNDSKIELIYSPFHQRPLLPGTRSREGLGASPSGIYWNERGETGADSSRKGDQFAARFSTILGQFEGGVHFFQGMDRNLLTIGAPELFYTQLVPGNPLTTVLDTNRTDFKQLHFYQVRQFGASGTFAWESWLFKFEGARKIYDVSSPLWTVQNGQLVKTSPPNHTIISAGLEYQYDFDQGTGLTFFAEGQFVLGPDDDLKKAFWVFQEDLFLGVRLTFNDKMDSVITLSSIIDIDKKDEFLISISFERRLSDFWKAKSSVRWFNTKVEGDRLDGLEVFNKDHSINLELIRYF